MFTADYHMDVQLYEEAARESWDENKFRLWGDPDNDAEEQYYTEEFPLLNDVVAMCIRREDNAAYGDDVWPLLDSDDTATSYWERLLVENTTYRSVGNFVRVGCWGTYGNPQHTVYATKYNH